jgi:hypothetical protein
MNPVRTGSLAMLALSLALPGRAQPNLPHVAYVYPAGGRLGTTFQAVVGGQFLGAVSNVYVNGHGIQARVLEYNRPMNFKEFNSLRDEIKALQEKRQVTRRFPSGTNVWTSADQIRFEEIRARILKNPPNRQANPAMAETVLVQIALATNAEPGMHEIRLRSPAGLSNPLNFQIGRLPEFSEPPARAPNPDLARFLARLGAPPAIHAPGPEMRITLPATVNGQIMPGGVNRCRFLGRRGQQLVISVGARALIPYLADAVPGWFEATTTIYDARGNELAYGDRFLFRPDPVVHFTVPRDGEYRVEIHDSIYRGREDFVYRMSIGELPFPTGLFPLGGQSGATATVQLKGWNLPTNILTLDNTAREPCIYPVCVGQDMAYGRPLLFSVDSLPECREREPNDTADAAQPISPPLIINGRIDAPGDQDVFRIQGRAGERLVAEVQAHRLGSPLDSTLQLTDDSGKVLAFNDDFDDPACGLETHHADSRTTVTLPANGTCYVCVADAQQHGGPDYAYRLKISAPRPDFALRVVPSGLSVRAGMNAAFTVFALRQDGFTNAIELRLSDAPPGFALGGLRIPANQDKARFTLKAPSAWPGEPVALHLEGTAVVAGRLLARDAVPADEMMQAFAYRHLVPAAEWTVGAAGNPRRGLARPFALLDPTPLNIPVGGTFRLRVAAPSGGPANRFNFQLDQPPAGIAMEQVPSESDVDVLVLHCDSTKASPGLAGNLIVSILVERRAGPQSAARQENRRGMVVGTLPAIPFEVVGQ